LRATFLSLLSVFSVTRWFIWIDFHWAKIMSFGRSFLHFASLDSTSDFARSLLGDPSQHGTVVVADFQTRGRGQYGRVWQAPPKSSLLFSLLLFPPPAICQPTLLTALAAVSVCETIAPWVGGARIKWPNDVFVEGKKIAGILIEAQSQPHPRVVIGIGLNLNQSPDDFARSNLPEATSLYTLTGDSFDNLDLAAKLLRNLEKQYDFLVKGDLLTLEHRWREGLGLLGKQVQLTLHPEGFHLGRLREVSFAGVVLERPDGEIETHQPEWIRQITLVGNDL
jgi:BirA family biotin operon repressor/biotin-[acetyl-CoA-carboxylase] ligase